VRTPDADSAPILVVGTGRSGTTLLRVMLNAHPRIYLTHEASFYAYRHLGGRRGSASDWLEAYMRTYSFAWLGLDPDAVRAEVPDSLPRERMVDAYRGIMRAGARRWGRVRYGDKSPFHSGLVKPILHDFPDARIIHIVRDPRATVASLVKMPWAPGSLILNNWYCLFQLKALAAFRDRIHEVRLEDLLADPRAEMGRILEFVGEEWDEAVLDHTRRAPSGDVPPFPWLLTATRERGVSRSDWRTELSPEWIRLIERRHRRLMADRGYEPFELEREPSWWEMRRAMLRDLPEAARFMRRFLPVTRRLMGEHPPEPAEAQRQWLSLNEEAWTNYPGLEVPQPPSVGSRAPEASTV